MLTDKNGAELRPGDRVKVEFESTIPRDDGLVPPGKMWVVEPLRDQCWLEVIPSFLTKIEPPLVWTSWVDEDDRNTRYRYHPPHKPHLDKGGVRPELIGDQIVFSGSFWTGKVFLPVGTYPTVEAAKAAVEKALEAGT
jgi:hypothetical protein